MILISIYYIIYGRKNLTKLENFRFYTFFIPIFLILGLLITSLVTYKSTIEYNEVTSTLEKESYKIVEGVIQDFTPMPYSGHKTESFNVNNVHFEYSDYMGKEYFFNHTKSHNGPIQSNDQEVKIYYIDKPKVKEVCIPILPRCLEFNSTGNKIIKLWVEPIR